MARRPVSNHDLEREIHRSWLDLQQARLDDHPIRVACHERLMNQALDELGDRLRQVTAGSAPSVQPVR